MASDGINTRPIKAACVIAGVCFVAYAAFFFLALAYVVAYDGVSLILNELVPGWLWISGIFTCVYCAIRPRVLPKISGRRIIIHTLCMDLIIFPSIVLSVLSINNNSMLWFVPLLFTSIVFVVIWFLMYERAFKFPPSQRPPHAVGNTAAFAFPLLLWSRPAFILIIEIVVLGYWIVANRIHVSLRRRYLSLSLFLVAGLVTSPVLTENLILRPIYEAYFKYDIPDAISRDIIPAVENVNLTGLLNHSFYSGYLGDSLGAIKAHFQDLVRGKISFFRFSLPLWWDPGWYKFVAKSFATGLNFTYWVDSYSSPHARADAPDGSSLFETEMGYNSLYVNQSIIPLPSTTPHTETLGGSILLVNVQFYRACGCTCGISNVWFLMNPQWAIISVLFYGF